MLACGRDRERDVVVDYVHVPERHAQVEALLADCGFQLGSSNFRGASYWPQRPVRSGRRHRSPPLQGFPLQLCGLLSSPSSFGSELERRARCLPTCAMHSTGSLAGNQLDLAAPVAAEVIHDRLGRDSRPLLELKEQFRADFLHQSKGSNPTHLFPRCCSQCA